MCGQDQKPRGCGEPQPPKRGTVVLKIFRHHVPTWSLVELVADGALCLAAFVLAVTRLPDLSMVPRQVPLSDVILRASVLAACMALMYAFVGLYRQSAVQVGWRSLV